MSYFWQAMSISVTYYLAIRAISGSVVCVAMRKDLFLAVSVIAA